MKRVVVACVKLALVALLSFWVIQNVQWVDLVTTTDGDSVAVREVEIEGPWNADVVRVRGEVGEIEEIRPGAQADGRSVTLSPGLTTYFVQLDKLYFAFGALCYVFTLTAAAARWWWLLRVNGLDVSLGETIRLTWIGVFFNNVMPGQTGGDAVKAVYIVKRCPDGRIPALMSVIVDRILGLGSLALLGAVVVLFQLERFGLLALGIWGVLLLVAGIGAFAFSRRIRRLVRLDQILRRLPGKIAAPLMKVDEAIFFYRAHKQGILVWILLGTLNHVVTITSFLLMGLALGVELPAIDYFALIPVILIVSAVPIAPNGWGVGEWLFGSMFAKFGAVHLQGVVADPVQALRTQGVALSVLYRLHTTLWSLVGGAMLLMDKDRVTREEIEAEVSREESEATIRAQGGSGS
ncbi:MAG: lysylphosphatidylglycerol synthase transmembrane domain-containing protein [Planctomycetota bacterium]|nr:lysylphosphatidylglycerol synthase transmembrane domain-containing protein [Planctomycetota bacterium]MDA0933956.1 lysylphosphatidylglycerol synthase transmembrane domain-containing protein [Planctomycetota bacterium]